MDDHHQQQAKHKLKPFWILPETYTATATYATAPDLSRCPDLSPMEKEEGNQEEKEEEEGEEEELLCYNCLDEQLPSARCPYWCRGGRGRGHDRGHAQGRQR